MAHPVDVHVGRRLKQARTMRRMSQTDLGNELDLPFQQINKYETAANRISASKLYELANLLQVHPSYFFEGLDETDTVAAAITSTLDQLLELIHDEDGKRHARRILEQLVGRAALPK